MTDVFISYSRKDQDFVRKLYDALNEQERKAWVDWEGIPLTADWWAEISRGIEAADTFLFIISPDSVISQTCNREVEHAVLNHKRIVPIVRREALPEQMNSALARHNWLFAREDDDFDDCFVRLMDALNTDLEYVRGHTRLLVRAREWEVKQKDTSYLLRGVELHEAESWLAQSGGKDPKPTELQTNYILASRRASSARQRTLLAGVTGALAITVILALVAVGLFSVAQSQRELSEVRGTAVAQQAQTATNALGLSESRGTEVAHQAATAVAAEATSARRAVEWRGLAWSIASERAQSADEFDLALALALQSQTIIDPPPEVQGQILNAIYAPGTERIYEGEHTDWISSLALNADGTRLISSSKDGSLVLWDTATGEVLHSDQFGEVFEISEGLTANVDAPDPVAFHPTDPNIALIGFNNGILELLNVETWEVSQSVELSTGLLALTFSPDGSLIAAGQLNDQNNLAIYDAETLALVRTLEGHGESVASVKFSADGTRLLTGSDDGSARLWEVDTGEVLRTYDGLETEIDPDIQVIAAVFGNPDANNLPTITLATNTSIITFDEDTARRILEFKTDNTTTIADIALSPDGKTLVSAGYDSILSMWNMADGKLLRTFRGHRTSALRVIFDGDGTNIFSGSQDASIRSWYVRSGGETLRMSGFQNGGAGGSLALTSDGALAVVGGGTQDPAVLVWDLATGSLKYRLEGHSDAVLGIDTYVDESGAAQAITGSWDGTLRVWNLNTGEAVRTFEIGNAATSLEYNAAGTQVLTAMINVQEISSEVSVIDLESGEVVTPYNANLSLSLDATYNANESLILISGVNFQQLGAIVLVDADTTDIIRVFDQAHDAAVQYIVFSEDSTHAISGSQDGLIAEWEVATGRESQQFKGHSDSANQVAYSPDERFIVSSSYDDTYRVWERETGLQRLLLTADDDGRAVVFGTDGALYTVTRDGALTQWDLKFDISEAASWAREHRYVRPFTCAERQSNRIEPLCELR